MRTQERGSRVVESERFRKKLREVFLWTAYLVRNKAIPRSISTRHVLVPDKTPRRTGAGARLRPACAGHDMVRPQWLDGFESHGRPQEA